MVDEAARTGAIHEHASELASRALEFDRLAAARRDDPALAHRRAPAERARRATIRRFLLEERRSRVPVYDGSLDNIVGYVSAKDVVSLAWEGKLVVLRDLLRPVQVLPRDGQGHRGAALHAPRAPAHRHRRRRARRRLGDGDVRGPGRGAGGRHLQRARGGPAARRRASPTARRSCAATRPCARSTASSGSRSRRRRGPPRSPGLCAKLGGGIPNRNARLAAEDGTVLVVLDATPRAVKRVRVIPPPRPAAETRAATPP